MNKMLFVTLILMLSMVSVDISAQSFLKKLGNAVEKEVITETKKQVNKGIDKLTKKQKKQSQSEQKQVSSTQQEEGSNRSSKVQTIDVIVPYGPTTGTTNGHKWVDMGLPSGTRWATCNVGATSSEQPGKYYAWGEVASKTTYTEGNSKFHDKKATDISGDKVYDVAVAGWGGGWRMPTEKEFAELLHYCDWRYVQKNGRWGAEFTSPTTNNTVFLPAAGQKDGASLQEPNACGGYWTSTPTTDFNSGAHEYHFGAALGEMGTAMRYYGYSVRPVLDYDVKVEVPSSGEIMGHKWVDLGLPSGVKWATCNLGADAVDQDGVHYAWGEIVPYMDKTSKKNKMYGKKSGDISGNNKYDIARASWGGTWRIPTEDDFKELIENCTFEWTSMGRRSGLKVTSKINGNYLFLPASGKFTSSTDSYGYAHNINSMAAYWTSTPARGDYSNNAYAFNFSNSSFVINTCTRFFGQSIRPVSD